VPTDPGADVVFGAENLPYLRTGSTEGLDAMQDIEKPFRNRLGFNEAARRIVIAVPEGGDATLALILAELKRLEGQVGHLSYKVERFRYRDEVVGIPESFGTWRVFRKQTELIGQEILPSCGSAA
jgi:hypothetical protein